MSLASKKKHADPLREEDPRRRSERVLLAMPLEAKWVSQSGQEVQERVTTEVVSAHGALLRTGGAIPVGTRVQLTRPNREPSVEARVATLRDQEEDGVVRVGVELTLANCAFWGVSFPKTGNPRAAQSSPAGPSPQPC